MVLKLPMNIVLKSTSNDTDLTNLFRHFPWFVYIQAHTGRFESMNQLTLSVDKHITLKKSEKNERSFAVGS